MVTIRQIIALGCLLTSVGCGPQYAYVGKWTGKRNLTLPSASDQSALTSLNKVELTVDPDLNFVLVDESIPMEGRLRASDKTQGLEIEKVMGRPTDRPMTTEKPAYELEWLSSDSLQIRCTGKDTIELHRVPKP